MGRITADDLLQIADDGCRYELVKGVLRKMAPSGFEHGAVVANLTVRLGQHAWDRRLGIVCGGKTGFQLARDPDTVLAPDVAFVRRYRVERSGVTRRFWRDAPDLAVEVLSPGDLLGEAERKVRTWLAAGARVVWVVDTVGRAVAVYRHGAAARLLREDDVLDGGNVVPGFRCVVRELFPRER